MSAAEGRPGEGVIWTTAAGAGPAAMADDGEPYRPLRLLTAWLGGLLAAVVIVDIVDLGMSVTALTFLARARSAPGTMGAGSVARLEAIEIGLGVLAVVVSVATVVVFLVWFRRAYRNLLPLESGLGMRYAPGWAVGSWFVPFLNLVRPKRITDDIWRGSDPDLPPGDASWAHTTPPPIIMAWWLTWLVTSYLGRMVFRLFVGAEELDQLELSYRVGLAASLTDIVAAVLAMIVVFSISSRQQRRAMALARAGLLPPTLRHPAHV